MYVSKLKLLGKGTFGIVLVDFMVVCANAVFIEDFIAAEAADSVLF